MATLNILDRSVGSSGSADAWAATETGRAIFRTNFVLRDETDNRSKLTHSDGKHYPTKKWLKAKHDDSYSISSEIQLTCYIVSIARRLRSPEESKVRSTPELALSKQYEKLEEICTQMLILGRTVPIPNEDQWAPPLNQLISVATEDFAWAFPAYSGEPSPQAMPRHFARTTAEIFHDVVGHPRTFKPYRGLCIPGFHHPRQFRCLTNTKKPNLTGCATLPVITTEYKAHGVDIVQAEGQSLYSAGIAHPSSHFWPGKAISSAVDEAFLSKLKAADICTVRGPPHDLGEMGNVISLFLILREAAEAHVRAAFEGDEIVKPVNQPPDIPITPGPLVDWRARTLPPSLMVEPKPKNTKRKSTGQPGPREVKKVKRTAAAGGRKEEGTGENGEEGRQDDVVEDNEDLDQDSEDEDEDEDNRYDEVPADSDTDE
ncbi:hypothetical protein DFH07DRAFT_1057628 [Mycena maculata]|uniref:Uncharacterized protein n=1 Tax=Mycena maculata TaxID=230809 RepID=A0AAD7NRF6_9AGAR|nr:hypothetical protein DFH07DRAFT_1057628 [Mycena maculata]